MFEKRLTNKLLQDITNLPMAKPVDIPKGTQVFEDVPEDQSEQDPVWRPVPHVAADKHTTGQAQYIDDLPRFKGQSSYTTLLM